MDNCPSDRVPPCVTDDHSQRTPKRDARFHCSLDYGLALFTIYFIHLFLSPLQTLIYIVQPKSHALLHNNAIINFYYRKETFILYIFLIAGSINYSGHSSFYIFYHYRMDMDHYDLFYFLFLLVFYLIRLH